MPWEIRGRKGRKCKNSRSLQLSLRRLENFTLEHNRNQIFARLLMSASWCKCEDKPWSWTTLLAFPSLSHVAWLTTAHLNVDNICGYRHKQSNYHHWHDKGQKDALQFFSISRGRNVQRQLNLTDNMKIIEGPLLCSTSTAHFYNFILKKGGNVGY